MNAVRAELWDVVRRLDELGLKSGDLREAVRRGRFASASCTTNHPPLMRGIVGWGETVCALRENLAPLGWLPSDENNYSLVVSPDGAMAIAVATGDENTGDPARQPATNSPKGPLTESAVNINQLNLSLPLPFEPVPAPKGSCEGRVTWFLLIYPGMREIRCELSQPFEMNADRRLSGWIERIILDAIPLDGDPVEITPPVSPDLDIQIRRRS